MHYFRHLFIVKAMSPKTDPIIRVDTAQLKAARDELNLTQEALTSRLEAIDPGRKGILRAIQKAEGAEARCRRSLLLMIANELDVPLETLVATVDIRSIDMKHWPGKIVEYEDAMNWINAASATKFTINYRTRLGFPI